MAVKNDMTKHFDFDAEIIMKALKEPRFAEMIDAEFIEEARTENSIEFRYVRKSTSARYGRNFFIKVISEKNTDVSVTVQSRKITVLYDNSWKPEAERVFVSLGVLAELLAKE